MPVILIQVSPGLLALTDVADVVDVADVAEEGVGREGAGNFKLAKRLPLATFASGVDGLARFGVANFLSPIARFLASFGEAVLDVCDKLEDAEPLAVLLPEMLGCSESGLAFDPGFSVAFSVGLGGEEMEC